MLRQLYEYLRRQSCATFGHEVAFVVVTTTWLRAGEANPYRTDTRMTERCYWCDEPLPPTA